ATEPAPPAVPSELATLVDRFWGFYLNWHPLEATYLGEEGYDDLLPDVTPGARAARHSQATTLAGGLAALDYEGLAPDDRLTYLALEQEIESELARQTCEPEAWVVDHREGIQLAFLNIVTAQPLETPEDGDRMIRRWNAIPDYLDDYISNLRSGLETGRVAARPSVDRTIAQLDALLERPVETWPIYAPAGTDISQWPEGTRHDFRAAIREAATNRIRPAYERLRDFLRDELYPSARTGGAVGLAGLPGGEACYRVLIREMTTLDLDPGTIHAIGLDELERIHAEMREVGKEALGTSDLDEIQRLLRTDPRMHFRWPAEIVQSAKAAYERAEETMPEWFGLRPGAELVIKPIPDYEAPYSIVAYYRQPAPDGSRPGTYHVNTYRPEIRPRYQSEVLTFHEGIPGHHLQTAIAQEIPGLPEFRRHLGSTAFVEGWALYAERLADEMGLYSTELDRLGLLSYRAWRAARLVVDTGLHAFGWTRERATEFLRENTLLAEANIENEVDRYITSPAQALTYLLGEREIRRLREEARGRLGERFDIADFHDRILENGALSLPALSEAVEMWLAERGVEATG
ncbi:MAG: DUF885 domain-containing protein, partial [Gemmatimonadota bacterium]|nr:DUF885 domain-containing protein [Gemmatimonadota bacterium]